MDLFDFTSQEGKPLEEKDNWPEIVNVHWYGEVDKLPDDVLYMGRGSP